MLTGIDTNIIYQGKALTAAKVKSEGADFHIAALTHGAYWDRPGTLERLKENEAAGLIVGAYHFLTRVIEPGTMEEVSWNSGVEQCRFFVDHLPRRGGKPSPEGLLIALDVENAPPTEVVRGDKAFRQDPNGPNWRIVREFVAEWFATFPLHPLFIYSSWGEWFRSGRDVRALNQNVFCWNANWVRSGHGRRLGRAWDAAAITEFQENAALGDPFRPRWGGFRKARLWQCTGFGIKGLGKVDGNLFDGTRAELVSFTKDRLPTEPDQPTVISAGPVRLVVAPAGHMQTLEAKTLRATLRLAPGAGQVARYRVEVGPRGARAAAFAAGRLWEGRGGPIFPERADLDDEDAVPVDDEPDDEDELPAPGGPGLKFEMLGGLPAEQRMAVKSVSPEARLRSSRPIKHYSWQLYQHGDVVERSQRRETSGLDPDAMGITIRLRHKLCPSEDPPEGYFFPPFRRRNRPYTGVTYSRTAEHPDHSPFSVDFNWLSGTADLGHPVLAAAPGVFAGHDPEFGKVFIDHWNGAYRTEYGHMDNKSIKDALKAIRRSPRNADRQGKPPLIGLLDQIGTISNTGVKYVHLHHVHFKRNASGSNFVRTKMRIGRRGFLASLSAAELAKRAPGWVSDQIPQNGWSAEARAKLLVSVQFADDGAVRKEIRTLRFTVGDKAGKAAKGTHIRPPAKTHSRSGRRQMVVIEHLVRRSSVPAGEYSLRFRCVDDLGNATPWAYDDSLVVG